MTASERDLRERDVVDVVLEQWARERPELDVSPLAVFGRLRRSSGLALRDLEQFLRGHGLSAGSFDILANLRRGGAPFQKTPSELAVSTLLTTGAITGRLDALEERDLIQRVPSSTDRRVVFARLTDSGRKLIDVVFEEHLQREHAILAQLTVQQHHGLVEGLTALERALQRPCVTPG